MTPHICPSTVTPGNVRYASTSAVVQCRWKSPSTGGAGDDDEAVGPICAGEAAVNV